LEDQCVITRQVTAAAGVFAPGHLGELTQLVPFEMVDEALAQTKTVQRRVRDLPSRVVVYLLLAACLFPDLGYPGVWRKLAAGLAGLPVAAPAPGALAQARRAGSAPLRWLFDLLRGPAAVPRGCGVWWRGLLVCAIDGTILTVPDSPANRTRFTKQAGSHGGTGYPQVQLLALVACGTRTLIDAVSGPTTSGETTYAPGLLRSLRAGMIMLADRNFAAGALAAKVAATQAEFLIRVRTGRGAPKLPALRRYRDGSYLSRFGGVPVRVIDAQIIITTTAGRRHTGTYRLITTLRDHHRYPASSLVCLYHQRWEIETAYLEIKSTILGGRVLRSRTPAGLTQEIYALLITYQLLRTAMADATSTAPRNRPRPGQLHHRLAGRPRPAHPGGRRHRRNRRRPGRHHRPPRPGRPAARPAAARQPPHRQTRHPQIPGPRPRHRPRQLQSHREHRHPGPARRLDSHHQRPTTRP
jgi:hypothetical protein